MVPAGGTSPRSSIRLGGRFRSSMATTSAPAKSCGPSTPSRIRANLATKPWGKNFEGGDSSQNRTGNNVWAFALTVDEEHGIVYEPVSGPGANYYGGDRPGANLYGNTLVALDAGR